MDALTAEARIRLLQLRIDVAKAKGRGGGGQPRHPAGSSLGGQWMSQGAKGVLASLWSGASSFGIAGGAKTVPDPNYGEHKDPPAHTIERKGSLKHPAKDDKGRDVFIHRPKASTHPGAWEGKDTVVTVTPGANTPKSLNGIPFTKWGGAKDWTTVSGQNPDVEKGLPDLGAHKWKHASAGVIVMEPDGRVWLTSPTNGYGGYRNTFPKGTQEPGLNLQQTAIKEAWEETGLKVKITGVLGDFERTTSIARIYIAQRVGGTPSDQGWESQALRLAPRSTMKSFLNMPVDRDIADTLWEEHDLTKARPGFTPEQVRQLARIIANVEKAKAPPAKQGAWTNQPRWKAGSPLGGQWKSYDAAGLPKPPSIGSAANPGWGNKAQAAYDAVAAGNIDAAVLILKPLELKAMQLGYDPSDGSYGKAPNSQAKWAQQAHQYVSDLIATKEKAGSLAAKVDSVAKTPTLGDYKKIGAKPGGSNPGGVYADAKGTKWLVKGANFPSDDRAKNEVLASKLMQAAGIAAPDMQLVDLQGQYGGGLGVAAKMEDMTGWSKSNAQHLQKAQSEFAVHAWLANYDAVGMPAGDNLAMKGGQVFNYDPGGALLYRAQGLPKTLSGGMLAHTVNEWDSMRNKSINAAAASVYGSMTADQLKASAEKLQAVSDQTIADLVTAYGPGAKPSDKIKLITALKARRDDILAKAGLAKGPKTADKAAAAALATPTPPKPAPAPVAAPAPAAAPSAPAGDVQYQHTLEHTKDGHNKFWRITVQAAGDGFLVSKQWGKIGTNGQTMLVGTYMHLSAAKSVAQDQANAKLAKGYKTKTLQEQAFNLPNQPAPKSKVDGLHGMEVYDVANQLSLAHNNFTPGSPIGLGVTQALHGLKEGNQEGFTAGVEAIKAATQAAYVHEEAQSAGKGLTTKLNDMATKVGMQPVPAWRKEKDPLADEPEPQPAANSGQAWTEVQSAIQLAEAYGHSTVVANTILQSMNDSLKESDLPKLASFISSAGGLAEHGNDKISNMGEKLQAYGMALQAEMEAKGISPDGPGTAAAPAAGMATVPYSTLAKIPLPKTAFPNVKGGTMYNQQTKGALIDGRQALAQGDMAKLQQAYDDLATIKTNFKIGSMARATVNNAQAHLVKLATEESNLVVNSGVFSVKPTGEDRAAKSIALKLLTDATGFGGEGMLTTDLGLQVMGAVKAINSGDDHAAAAYIGSVALSGAMSAQVLSEKLTELAEAKGGMPIATGHAATVTHTTSEPGPTATTNNPLNLPPTPPKPQFAAGATGNTVDYYNGLVAKMDDAYAKGDLAALQQASMKPNGAPVWPVFKTGVNKGLPKSINGQLASKYFNELEGNLLKAVKAKTAADIAAPVAVPAQGENIGNLPAMPRFAKHKIADTNSNAGSHNAKIDTIEKLASKGDVKGLLALNYGTNTYGKKQAKLANSALSAMGSPFQVDIGQKKNSHPALSGDTSTAGVAKSGALTAKELPPPLNFANWNGQGKGLSSSEHVNASNQAAFDKLTQLAMAGDVAGLKNFTFQPIDKNTGQAVGSPKPIGEHPSQHVKGHQEYLLQAIDEKLNPPKPLEIFEAKQAAASVSQLSAKFPPKPLGITSKKVPSSQAIGHYIAVGQVTGGEKLVPKVTKNFNPAQVSQAHSDYQTWKHDSKAEAFRKAVQGHGGHEYHGGWDSPNESAKGSYGSNYTGAELTARAKAAHKWARKQPAGTKIYKWENLTKDMKAKLETAQPGLIIQNPAPSCASYSPTATSGFGSSHRWTFVYAEGAKGLNSFGSGAFSGEKEVTLLPNSRFMILEHHKAGKNGNSYAETIVLLLPPDPALDSDGYTYG